MATVGDKVEEVRSMLRGSLSDELSVLDDDYAVGTNRLTLRYPKPNLQPGTIVTCGLNTFYCLSVTSNGSTMTVHPSADGGPEVAVSHGEVIRIKPAHTTWAIFREWCNELEALSSPEVGLYGYGSFDAQPDYANNVYRFPDTGAFLTLTPIRLLSARYQVRGFDQWQRIHGVEWQPEHRAVRVYGSVPNAAFLRFIFAFPFLRPDDLSTTTTSLGLTATNDDIPGLGVAARLSLSDEARRNMIAPQGDPRRPTEVMAGANIGVARMFQAKQAQRIAQESARLLGLFGYTQMTGVSGE